MGRALREEDYVGKKFNHLTVIRKTNQKRNGTYLWEFLCDCGNTYYNIMSYVKSGNSKSCGCQKSKGLIDWNTNNRTIKIGDVFGKLTVLKEAGLFPYSDGHQRMKYVCQCECGNIVEKWGNCLKQGQTKSCGCLKSEGERQIELILKENNIIFKTEYIDEKLVRDFGRKLRFDFAIFNEDGSLSHYIEFQGKQHFEGFDTEYFSNAEPLSLIKERDAIKRKYCKKYGIRLIEIPYTKLNHLILEDLL